MKKIILCLGLLISSQVCLALSGQAYMDRFNTYLSYSQNLPSHTPNAEFLDFIAGTTPLSTKLREKWLYELAKNKNWVSFSQYYQPSNDLNLVCYEQIANYNTGKQEEALKASIPLWLSGDSRPPSCDSLFTLLLKDNNFDQNLITQRLALALERRNIQLARYLLKQYNIPHTAELNVLNSIYQNPANITMLNPGGLNSDIYLYGLKRMVSINMNKALALWQQSKTQKMLNSGQQQSFLAHVALYKAMRNHEDALEWFAKVKPQYYNDVLLDWQIRFALKRKDWAQVTGLINDSKHKDEPCWQYWLARSLEEQGKITEAKALYEPLARNRQYYGFLASLRLNKKPSFTNEAPTTNLEVLKPYQTFIDQIQTLYMSKQTLQASRLLNDFISELPKDEASALVYWIDQKLQWHGKSVYLSNNETLNNQLSLRFPLAYKDSISMYSKRYAVAPEFIYAIIRQESGFRDDATSSVGARGLMQVMPYTARVVSKADKIPYTDQNQLFLSQKNINIGVAYLKQLAKRFGNHPILIAAAYNAGPKQVVYWLRSHPPKEIDVWIETLPWQETRNYLKNIMAFYVVYQYRLGQKPNLGSFLEPL
ncbi:transglycosylase SLT domain-containing protein [Fluoribacter dumoffii]|uniref:Soluble lytic murein transglycosylase n=1 Tax=Fluoribacter dumoffii TaxID=463 RepID=A0A377G7S3_9GAMM|nr:transglycosylase SLT domain-containing protein [Fluoribacter dumoffii]KTC89442.1 soluble lytic murein transglycosylase [Fluoribacter dumoffii NY 23]MCW8417703.1 transglycosylase SLT domain-containing protein [Fluoribacter dumoffii]MCW8454455.1 transglycosylase SLT domain-containing protein [Fluoribacter dumoffii]MCW8461471.1 transglycosylase SLT domain-containing protein [Fluoribacter dumoffii]MCW8484909.1 transglycosylase SLT domain-containing protein [Fluoribacter dumoffii]